MAFDCIGASSTRTKKQAREAISVTSRALVIKRPSPGSQPAGVFLLRWMNLLVARTGHADAAAACPLLRNERTQRVAIGATLARTTSNICPTLYELGED
jgi:hypothetical protein